ncbi:MAG: hypothetical protein HFP78_03180 [Methylococcales symbiont of Hymedesmia sp. n. MRB-2018]|nr:MAG: hypothetical protein HFP78_03180 [Methylococcales symbiont of Hymedesmia sp. n. MRB-2018]
MYQSDDFDDNDMAFVETQSKIFAEDIYSLEFDESAQSSENKEAQKSSNDRHVLSTGSVKTGEFKSKNDKKRVQIICRGNRKVTLNNYVVSSLKHDDLNGVMEDIQNSILPHTNEKSSLTIPPPVSG